MAIVGAAVFLVAAGIAIHRWPVVFWTDAVDRLSHRDDLIVWRWLPLLQCLIWLVARVTPEVEPQRWAMAVVAAAAIVASGLFTRRLFSGLAGLIAGVLLATNSMFLMLATQPYQEPLFALLLYLAVHSLAGCRFGLEPAEPGPGPHRRGLIRALVASTLLCLTRYEGWLFAALLAGEAALAPLLRRNPVRAIQRGAVVGVLSGGLVAAIWVMTEPIEVRPWEARWTERFAPGAFVDQVRHLAGSVLRRMSPVIPVLAAFGAVAAWRSGRDRATHGRILAFAILDGALLVFTEPLPDTRRPFVILTLLVPYAGAGAAAILRQAIGWFRRATAPLAVRGLGYAILAVLPGLILFVARSEVSTAIQGIKMADRDPKTHAIRAAALWLGPRASTEDIVVTESRTASYVFSVYSGWNLQRVVKQSQGIGVASTAGRVHLLIAGKDVVPPDRFQDRPLRHVEALTAGGGIAILTY